MGCSCVPSPALTIGICRCRARKCGAPDAAWRITIAFGRIATSVFSVSTSDSPFDTLDACAAIETVSAPSRLAAISKLTRVRVEASKNRLTIILPRSASRRRKRLTCARLKKMRPRRGSLRFRSRSKALDIEQAGDFNAHLRGFSQTAPRGAPSPCRRFPGISLR